MHTYMAGRFMNEWIMIKEPACTTTRERGGRLYRNFNNQATPMIIITLSSRKGAS